MDSAEWDQRYAAAELVWSAEPNQFFAAEVGSLPAGRALDVACGEGRNAIWLAERGWDVTAVDFSRVAIEKARKLARARGVEIRWAVADVVTSTLQPRTFDLVAVLYGPDDVVADIGDLHVVKAERVERTVATGEGPKRAIDVLVRATRQAHERSGVDQG